MSGFKRTITSLFYKVDQVVSEIENHDALIQSAIREQQTKLVAARVECSRINKRSNQLRTEIQELEVKRDKWEQRAVLESTKESTKGDSGQDVNKERALACVQQAQSLTEQMSRLSHMSDQYGVAVEKMTAEINTAAQELDGLKQKHQFMRARQATADALGRFGDIGSTRLDNVETSFDRWEVKIGHADLTSDIEHIETEAQNLERVYVKEENAQKLEARLAELLTKQGRQE